MSTNNPQQYQQLPPLAQSSKGPLPDDVYGDPYYAQGVRALQEAYQPALDRAQHNFMVDHPVVSSIAGLALFGPAGLAAPMFGQNMRTRQTYQAQQQYGKALDAYSKRFIDMQPVRTGRAESQIIENLLKNSGVDPRSVFPDANVTLSKEMQDRILNGLTGGPSPESVRAEIKAAQEQGLSTGRGFMNAPPIPTPQASPTTRGWEPMISRPSGGGMSNGMMGGQPGFSTGAAVYGQPELRPGIYQNPTLTQELLSKGITAQTEALKESAGLYKAPAEAASNRALAAYRDAQRQGQVIENRLLPGLTKARINAYNRPPAGNAPNPLEAELAGAQLRNRQIEGQKQFLDYLKSLQESAGSYNPLTRRYYRPDNPAEAQRYDAIRKMIQGVQDKETGGVQPQTDLRQRHQATLRGL